MKEAVENDIKRRSKKTAGQVLVGFLSAEVVLSVLYVIMSELQQTVEDTVLEWGLPGILTVLFAALTAEIQNRYLEKKGKAL